jgi:hypothetical protein
MTKPDPTAPGSATTPKTGSADMDQHNAAAAHLRLLLTRPGPYRQRWMRQADNLHQDGKINQTAVTKVIAEYLAFYGRLHLNDKPALKRLGCKISRALSGATLTPDTLRLFMRAFNFSDDDTRQLWSALTGANPEDITDIFDDSALPPIDDATPRAGNTANVTPYDILHAFRDVTGWSDDQVLRYQAADYSHSAKTNR